MIIAVWQKGVKMDLIERRAAINAVNKLTYPSDLMDVKRILADIPSTEPKKGKWEMKPDPYGFFDDIPVCSECGCTTKMREKTKYCPNCGAKMEADHE